MGALFDRTPDGLILQRDFGGHRYARLAHVGDRTGLEMIRTLQQHAVHKGLDVYMECNLQRLLTDTGRISGAFGYWRESGKFILFKCKAVVLATGGGGKAWKVTSNSWEYTGDGVTMAMDVGADLMDMEFMQFHPTGMVWPPSVRGILVTEGVRGDGGTLKNTKNERFMFNYIPEFFKAETADTIKEADAWYKISATTGAHRICCRATKSQERSTRKSKPAAAHRTAESSWISRRAVRRITSSVACRPCIINSKSWPMSISPKIRWKSARPVIIRWAVCASTRTPLRQRSRDFLLQAKWQRGCTALIGWAATRCPTCWYSAGVPACMLRNT